MKRFLILSLLFGLGAFAISPVFSQSDDDEEAEIEIEETPEEEEEPAPPRRNGGRQANGDDPGAPKVKIPLQQQINKAIKDGVLWLRKNQNKDGSWDPTWASREYGTGKEIGKTYRDEMGPTFFALYTLAKCGVDYKKDRYMKRGLKYVFKETEFLWDEMGGQSPDRKKLQESTRKTPRIMSTYEVAASIMMIEAVYTGSAKLTGKQKKRVVSDNPLSPPRRSRIRKEQWRYMHERIRFLTVGRRLGGGGGGGRRAGGRSTTTTIPGLQVQKGPNMGGWRYQAGQQNADLSATQFALLALRAASQAGYPVERTSKNVYQNAARYIMTCQRPSGGFAYQQRGGRENGSMTACGVGSLLICKEQMMLIGQTVDPKIDASIKRGMKWLDENFDATNNPGLDRHHFYYLYGVERVGDLAGRKEFNKKDWYVRGARHLVGVQAADGSWNDPTEAFPPRGVNSTTLALLFLKRATPPTVTMSDG
ncbi:MAG: prenyltransferase/squalene oxidase repeat-containing protein [Planctomycetota bacterium]